MVRPAGVQNSGVNFCAICGSPADAGWFDESSIQPAPAEGDELVLARYQIPQEYCGQLMYFSQYIFSASEGSRSLHTPEFEWSIRVDGRRLAPYASMDHIVNPWGIHGFPIHLRLNGDNEVQFVIRRLGNSSITHVGGRLMGRYWYNEVYGGPETSGHSCGFR